jgi:oligoendopeptidase F
LDTFLSTIEIGSVGLVETHIWRWLYTHPDATAAELKVAVQDIARQFWNEHFAPLIGVADSPILAIYAHMLSNPTYLPNYSLGHIILFQLENYLQDKNFAQEVERCYKLGNLTPDQWLREAVETPLSISPLLTEAEKALTRLQE